MGLLNFKKQFKPFIERREKLHTIRAKRKHPIKVGERLYLYTGLRTKQAKKIGEVICVRVEEICISRSDSLAAYRHAVEVAGVVLSPSECELLARKDGFCDFAEMMRFWNGRLPFHGDIIHWKWPGEAIEMQRSTRNSRQITGRSIKE